MAYRRHKTPAVFILILLTALTIVSCGLRDAGSPPPVADTETTAAATNDVTDNAAGNDTSEPETSEPETTTPEAAEPETTAPETAEPSVISFFACGDNVIHPNLYKDALNRSADGETYNFLPMYADIADKIAAADLAFINQETIFGGDERGYSGYPCFNTPSDLGHDLVTLGFDIINIANNHMCDMGASGYENALDFYDTIADSALMTGGFRDEEDYASVRTIEADGLTIALLAYTYGTNGITLPASSELVVPYLDDAVVTAQLASAREIADFIIVSVHWGEENTQTPTGEQKRMAQLMADNGADVIIGHHSHVLQPVTELDNMWGGTTLCVYSLGNIVSSMMYPANMVGGLFTFDIVHGDSQRARAVNAVMTPTVFFYGKSWYDTEVFLMSEFTDELAAAHGTANYGYPCSVAYLRSVYTDAIDEKYRPEVW